MAARLRAALDGLAWEAVLVDDDSVWNYAVGSTLTWRARTG